MGGDMPGTVFLTPQQVADRYKGAITVRTLANWRSIGQGPDYVKIGGKVVYPADALQRWEDSRRRTLPG
jgi:hypothetical protein